jgi:hypothetical protein
VNTAAALLLLLVSHPEDPGERRPSDRSTFTASEVGASLDWSDAEDRVQLSVRPGMPHAGETATFTVQVGSFNGPPHDGAVVLSLRPPDGRAVVELPLAPAQKGGLTGTHALDAEGKWTVDVRFRTTRAKHVQADLPVGSPRRLPWAEVAGLTTAAAWLTWMVLRSTSSAPPRSTPPEDTPPSP